MRDLWRATVQLFWRHPILWLPVAVADAIALTLSHLQRLLQKHAADGLIQTHSVLGGRPEMSSSQNSVIATYLISVCLVAISALLTAFLYTGALLTVAAMLRNLAHSGHARLDAAASIKPDFSRGVLFSLRLFTLSVVAGMVASSIVLAAERMLKVNYFSLDRRFAFAESTVAGIVAACLVAPHAIDLLRPTGSAPLLRQQIRLARLGAICTVTVSIALSFQFAKTVFPASPYDVRMGIHCVTSEIAMLPYTALFIAFALVAGLGNSLAIDPREPSEVRPKRTSAV
jgi:hypothetical protein